MFSMLNATHNTRVLLFYEYYQRSEHQSKLTIEHLTYVPWFDVYCLLHEFQKMGTHLQKEDCLIQIRDKLRKDGIKLWLPPYVTSSNNSSKDDIHVRKKHYHFEIFSTIVKL